MAGCVKRRMCDNSSMNSLIGLMALLILAGVVTSFVGLWKVFEKTGRPGWQALVPVYSTWEVLKMAGKPAWWMVLLLLPIINVVPFILAHLALARRFGLDSFYTYILATMPIVGYIVVGFGAAEYSEDVAV